MSSNREKESAWHPIGVTAKRTGLRQDVLRAWEKRYGAVSPHRTETGRRLYSDEDIEKLRLLRKVVDAGRRISDVAALTMAELRDLAVEDQEGPSREAAPPTRRRKARVRELLERCDLAIENMDRASLERTLREAEPALTKPQLRSELLVPLIHKIGDRWADGSLRIAHEHLATAVIRAFLSTVEGGSASPDSGPALVVATLPGQLHELGALLASATAGDLGWQVLYLGPNLPVDEIAAAAKNTDARAIALSLVYPQSEPATVRELIKLRTLVGDEVVIIVGGRAARSYTDALDEIHAHISPDLHFFQRQLQRIVG